MRAAGRARRNRAVEGKDRCPKTPPLCACHLLGHARPEAGYRRCCAGGAHQSARLGMCKPRGGEGRACRYCRRHCARLRRGGRRHRADLRGQRPFAAGCDARGHDGRVRPQCARIAEAMRAHSLAITPYAMLSRALCMQRGRHLVVNLPGSEKAARENWGRYRGCAPACRSHDGRRRSLIVAVPASFCTLLCLCVLFPRVPCDFAYDTSIMPVQVSPDAPIFAS